MKKFICLFLSLSLLFVLTSCYNTTENGNELICSLEVRCDDALLSDALFPEKREALPTDGIIIPKTELSFIEGETVFDVVSKKLRGEKIHFEFSETPATSSKYFEGISNLYQLDCGEFSGWGYLVNGEMPSVGASEFKLSDGDAIVFTYVSDFTKN